MVTPFASGLDVPADLAFDTAGDLFEADEGSGNIYEFVNKTGLDEPVGLAFQPAPEPAGWALMVVGASVLFGGLRRKNVRA